jgi:hypothetical protein
LALKRGGHLQGGHWMERRKVCGLPRGMLYRGTMGGLALIMACPEEGGVEGTMGRLALIMGCPGEG